MIDAKITILADSFSIEGTVGVLAFRSQLCATLGVITVFAHSVGIVLFTSMRALRNNFSMLLEDGINFVDLSILRGLLYTLGSLTLARF